MARVKSVAMMQGLLAKVYGCVIKMALSAYNIAQEMANSTAIPDKSNN